MIWSNFSHVIWYIGASRLSFGHKILAPRSPLVGPKLKTAESGDAIDIKKLANDFVTLALREDLRQIVPLRTISELEAQKRKKVSSGGTNFDGRTYLIRLA